MNAYDILTGQAPADRPGAGLARFWQLRGRSVIEAGGIFWGRHHGCLYQSLPFQLQLAPEAGEMEHLLNHARLPLVRFPSTLRAGVPCGLYVCWPKKYDLQSVCRKQRTHVRRGLETCQIRPVDPEELLTEGIHLNRETMQRQNRYEPEFGDVRRWTRFVDAVRQCPELSVTGAWVDGHLSVYVIACQEDGWVHLLYKNSRTSDLGLFVNHALDYTILRAAGADPSVRAVANYYAGSLSCAGLDQYKRQIGFIPVAHNLCVHVNPKLAPVLVSAPTITAIRAIHSLRPGKGRLESGLGLLQNAMITRDQDTSAEAVVDFNTKRYNYH